MREIGGNMKTTWKLQDAKSQFSKVVEEALKSGPQYVTRRGVPTVVIVSLQEYEVLTSNKPTFKEFLLSCPNVDEHFEIERQKDYPGSIEL
jgi:antitoxin Phd